MGVKRQVTTAIILHLSVFFFSVYGSKSNPPAMGEINYPPARGNGVWVYSLRCLKSKTATAINLIR